MILTVTRNPALDKFCWVDALPSSPDGERLVGVGHRMDPVHRLSR